MKTNRFKDTEHLWRVALVFAAGIIVFVLVRAVLVPRSFGEYGHYRGNAIAEIAAKPVVFAGHQVCETCHSDVLAVKKDGKHRRRELRSLPRRARYTRGRSGHGPAAEARYSRSLRSLPPGERRQAQRFPSDRCPGTQLWIALRNLSSTAQSAEGPRS